AKPFVWSAERDVLRVTLSGSSPLPASKGRLMEAARANLGGVEVVDRMNLSRGAPPRFDNAVLLLLDQVGKLKYGKITLSVTNVHGPLAAAAGRKFFSEKVVDSLKASVGAPAGFANAVVPALGALSRLSTGTLVVSDREVKLSGDALHEAAAGQIRAGLGKDF